MRAEMAEKGINGLYAIIDTSLVSPPMADEVAGQLFAAGVRLVQLRAKGLNCGEFLRLAKSLKGQASDNGALFIVNDRADIAVASGADGLHLGQSDIPVDEARRLLGEDKIIGLSTHNLEQAETANGSGADYVSFGPVFATSTKIKAGPCLGLALLREARGIVKKPLVAIGGIRKESLADVFACGVDAAAVISHILKSDNPGKKARELISGISEYA